MLWTTVAEASYTDSHDVDGAPLTDTPAFTAGVGLDELLLFVACEAQIAGGPAFDGFNSVVSPKFSEYTGAPDGTCPQAYGPGMNTVDAVIDSTDLISMETAVIAGDTFDVVHHDYYPGGPTPEIVSNRVYLALKTPIFDTEFPAPYLTEAAFDGWEANYPGLIDPVVTTTPSITMPAGDRYWTRTGADPQGKPGFLLAYIGWNSAGGTIDFTPDAPWLVAGYYNPPDNTYGICVCYQEFGPDDADYTFSGTLTVAAANQMFISDYRANAMPSDTFADGPGIRFSFGKGTHEPPDWTRVDDPTQPSESL
jgi:hypothetical protein